MPQVAFFPWFTVRDEVDCGPFHLSRYETGAVPGGEEQAALDAVIAPYRTASGHSVSRCALLSLSGSPILTEWSDEQRDAMFRFAEILAFSGLAVRSFFSQLQYSNRDNFRLIIQSFREPGAGTLIVTRRRDGNTQSFYSGDTHQVRCPPHVLPGPANVDTALLHSLPAAENRDEWPRLLEAMILFNEANTDRDFMPEAAELVLMCAALEQLLETRYQPRELADRLQTIWVPVEPLPHAEWRVRSADDGVNRRLMSASSLRGAWIEDLGVVRGSMAHGHGSEAYRGIWSPAEHLLFAAFVVPRIMKLRLNAASLYDLTDDDLRDVDCLEALLNERHFVECEAWDHPWPKIINRAGIARIARRIAEQCFGDE